ncbi:MAG: hypothetical protein AAFQ51_13215, partial [Pseudomonadota bacterium]
MSFRSDTAQDPIWTCRGCTDEGGALENQVGVRRSLARSRVERLPQIAIEVSGGQAAAFKALNA